MFGLFKYVYFRLPDVETGFSGKKPHGSLTNIAQIPQEMVIYFLNLSRFANRATHSEPGNHHLQ